MEREYIVETSTFHYPFVGNARYERSEVAFSDSLENAVKLANTTLSASIRMVKCIKNTCKFLTDTWVSDGSAEDYYQVSQAIQCEDSIMVLGVKVYHRPKLPDDSITDKEE